MMHKKLVCTFILCLGLFCSFAQKDWTSDIEAVLPQVLKTHREFVSLPNVADNTADMYKNIAWVTEACKERGFAVRLLESATLPVFLAEKEVDPQAKTLLIYFHLDGQPADPANWDQEDPFVPVLKAENKQGKWEAIEWARIDGPIDPEWRVFGRAAADDKAPIMMMLTALDLLEDEGLPPKVNVKIILDPQEEAGSDAFLSTLEKYQSDYAADYMLIMDGPAHPSNRPTLTFGCRGIATCNITVYGAKLPQHSGHYGNYAPNPVFILSHLLASMKNEAGRVTISGYYDGIEIDEATLALFASMPDDEAQTQRDLFIHEPDAVGNSYQEALQYPSLNVRHIETSWKGPGLKTVIPEWVRAHIDVRLVKETDGAAQMEKIRKHIAAQGFLVLDRSPTDAERLAHRKIATFEAPRITNAFRTDMDTYIGEQLAASIEKVFGEDPIKIRTMGGTVPIIEAVNILDIPAIIVPMVNMDNNQHNPNENIRIGNIKDGILTCLAILQMDLK